DSFELEPLPSDFRAADPWFLWHQLRDGALLNGTKLRGYQRRGKLPVLVQRREGANWPDGLELAPFYRENKSTIGTGFIKNESTVIKRVRDQVLRLKVARPVKQQLFDAMPAIAARSVDNDRRPHNLTGKGVVIGFVDNGCAFAHPNFVKDNGARTRVVRLWDQSLEPKERKGWSVPPKFGYGLDVDFTKLDLRTGAASNRSGNRVVITPDELYKKLGYGLTEIVAGVSVEADVTHGTHVMDIAAGSGPVRGMAPDADLIFVQLPQSAILENTDQAS